MNINNLLTNKKSAYERKLAESRALVSNWERTGLLEGLATEKKAVIAQLLENQATQVLKEASATGHTAGSEEWAGIALPTVRRLFGEISAEQFVGLQTMNLPTSLVFWVEFKYGTGQPGFTTGSGKDSQEDSIWGVTDASKGDNVATGGLYGAGRFGYTINDYNATGLSITGSGTPAGTTGVVTSANLLSDINYDTQFSSSVVNAAQIKKLTIPVTALTNPDLESVRAYTISGTGIETLFNQYTTVSNDKQFITFLISGSGVNAADLAVYYQRETTKNTRGDFEAGKTGDDPLDIPELNIEWHQKEINAKTRKLKAIWTPEFAQDITQYHAFDVETEITNIMCEYVGKEIELEILDMLIQNAQTSKAWSCRMGYEHNGSSFTQTALNVGAYTQGTWFQTLGTKIQAVSNEIDRLTLRGGANFIVTSPAIATILESIPGYATDTAGDSKKFTMGSQKIGQINNRFTVYKSSYMTENIMLVGFKGNSMLETGAVYCPYVPLIQTPTIPDPENFTPRKAVMTRYAKAILRPEFYGKIYVEGLHTI